MIDIEIINNIPSVGQVTDAYNKALKKAIDRGKTQIKKRMKRLENNNLTDSPAYKQYLKNDVVHFSVKGKSTQELQSMYWQLKRLNDMKTGTVKGAQKVLKEIADNTGITYKNINQLNQKSKLFFNLASKAQDYLESMGETAKAIDYRAIWHDVSDIMKQDNKAIEAALGDIENLSEDAFNNLSEDIFSKLQDYFSQEINDL